MRIVEARWEQLLVDKCVNRGETHLVRLLEVAADTAFGWDARALLALGDDEQRADGVTLQDREKGGRRR